MHCGRHAPYLSAHGTPAWQDGDAGRAGHGWPRCVAGGCSQPVDGPILVLTLASPGRRETEANGPCHPTSSSREVDARSAGTMRIDVDWDVNIPKGSTTGSYQVVAHVRRRRHLRPRAWCPARAWDVLGVTSLRALNTPFLVSSDAAMRAVHGRATCVDDLLAGLAGCWCRGASTSGRASMRRLFGFDEAAAPPGGPCRAQKIRSPTSKTVTASARGAGCHGRADRRRSTDGTSADSSRRSSARGQGPRSSPPATWCCFPKVETLVADDALRSRLQPGPVADPPRRGSATRRDQLESFPERRGMGARPSAAGGGEIVGDHARATWRPSRRWAGRSGPSSNRIRAPPRLIDEIEAVVSTVPPAEPITACPAEGVRSAASGPDDTRGARRDLRRSRDAPRHGARPAVDRPRARSGTTPAAITWTLDGGSVALQVMRANHYLPNSEDYGTVHLRGRPVHLALGRRRGHHARGSTSIDDGSIRFKRPARQPGGAAEGRPRASSAAPGDGSATFPTRENSQGATGSSR